MFLHWVKHYGVLHDIPVLAAEPHFTSQECSNCKRIEKRVPIYADAHLPWMRADP
jgi:transposase